MKYSAPDVEIEALNTKDVVMISGFEVQKDGELTEIGWGTFA